MPPTFSIATIPPNIKKLSCSPSSISIRIIRRRRGFHSIKLAWAHPRIFNSPTCGPEMQSNAKTGNILGICRQEKRRLCGSRPTGDESSDSHYRGADGLSGGIGGDFSQQVGGQQMAGIALQNL